MDPQILLPRYTPLYLANPFLEISGFGDLSRDLDTPTIAPSSSVLGYFLIFSVFLLPSGDTQGQGQMVMQGRWPCLLRVYYLTTSFQSQGYSNLTVR